MTWWEVLIAYWVSLIANGTPSIIKLLWRWYEKLKQLSDNWEDEKLKEQLSIILDTNEELRKKLTELQKWWNTNTYKFENLSNARWNFGNNWIYNESK